MEAFFQLGVFLSDNSNLCQTNIKLAMTVDLLVFLENTIEKHTEQ